MRWLGFAAMVGAVALQMGVLTANVNRGQGDLREVSTLLISLRVENERVVQRMDSLLTRQTQLEQRYNLLAQRFVDLEGKLLRPSR